MMNAMILLAALAADDTTAYRHPELKIGCSVPSKGFTSQVGKIENDPRMMSQLFNFQAQDGTVYGALLFQKAATAAEGHAEWREKYWESQPTTKGVRRLSSRALDRKPAKGLLREYSLRMEVQSQVQDYHVVSVFLADGTNNFELMIFAAESQKEAALRIAESIRYGEEEKGAPRGGLKCAKCGAAGDLGRKFCGECGAKIEIETLPPAKCGCGALYRGQEKFCGECGAPRGGRPQEDVKALYDQAVELGKAEKYAEAEKVLDRILEVDTKTALVWSNRGYMRYRQGKWDGAIADFTEALRLNADPGMILAYRGVSYAQVGRNREALADLRRAVELVPELEKDLRPMIRQLEDKVK